MPLFQNCHFIFMLVSFWMGDMVLRIGNAGFASQCGFCQQRSTNDNFKSAYDRHQFPGTYTLTLVKWIF